MVLIRRQLRLDLLLQRTGYSIIQTNGQRIYFNPNCHYDPPPKGCEVFVGKLPRDILEDELVPIFENLGVIYQIRLMMDFNGRNRGFCFVTYHKKVIANMAVVLLNGFEIRRGCKIGIFKSLDNTRLFVGGIPVDKSREEVCSALRQYVDGIQDVIMYSSLENQSQNRGYAFVEFGEHRLAAIAKRRLQPGTLILWGIALVVDWADPLPDTDPNIMSMVTKLYVRNINVKLSIGEFKEIISNVLDMSTVLRVHKINDYAFIHFVNREIAEDAMRILQDFTLDGRKLDVSWARPEIYSNNSNKSAEPNHFCLSLPSRIRKLVKNKRKGQLDQFNNKPALNSNLCNNRGGPQTPIYTHHQSAALPFQHPPPGPPNTPLPFQPSLILNPWDINENLFRF